MRISNNILRLGLACGLVAPLSADELSLVGGDARLTGTVLSINEGGAVELASPLSPSPLLLKSGAVGKVTFSAAGAAPEPPAALIELTNGDLLPAGIENLSETKLTVTSPEAGRLEIPREAVASIQLGIHRRKVVYRGPKSLDEWSGPEGDLKNWTFERDSLVANGPGVAMKKLALPEKFTFRFTMKWQARQIPNFQVHFADPHKPKGEVCDRYYLQFGGAGLELKREASTGRRYTTLKALNRTPNQYPDHELTVEIRVDRKTARMQLFLNGEPEGEFMDPIASVPAGSGITLVCNAQNGSVQEITGIEISELDDSRVRHKAEERGDPKSDSLISREDDRWGGRLLDVRKSGGSVVFRFKSDFQNDPLEIPEADVSTIFFAGKPDAAQPGEVHPFVLRLRGEGSLRVASCLFTPDAVTAVHPLLGPLKFRRDGIAAMERTDSKTKPAPEP